MKLKIQVFRRWCLEEPLESVLRRLREAFAWAAQQGEDVVQLRMGDFLYDRQLGIVGVRVGIGDDWFWRLCFETPKQGMVCVEVYNKSASVFSWVKYVHYVLVHGLEYSEVKALRLGYRKDVRVQLGRCLKKWDGVNIEELVKGLVGVSVVLLCEYVGLLSCHKVFAKVSSARMRLPKYKSRCAGFDYWVSKIDTLLYEPVGSMVGTLQPEEVVGLLEWFRMYYETVYRKVQKSVGADVDVSEVMKRFTDSCIEVLRRELGGGLFMWSNSLVSANLNCAQPEA